MAKHILMYEGVGPSLTKAREIIANSQGVMLLETLGENTGPALTNVQSP